VAEVKAGFVVNLDAKEIAKAILEIVNSPALANEMGKLGGNSSNPVSPGRAWLSSRSKLTSSL